MKIVFTGSGSGGHFYPIIAVAQEILRLASERKLVAPTMYHLGPDPYDREALLENNIIFKKSAAGKMRRYFSLLNVFDLIKTGWGILRAVWQLFFIYPDVVFSKGGYASFPTTVAARILRIPVIVHESDAHPGRANIWAGKFAKRVALSYPEAASYFNKEKVALTGVPVRRELRAIAREGGKEFFNLRNDLPTLLILGGSQGAVRINNAIIEALPELVKHYQIIHQTGKTNVEEVRRTTDLVLRENDMRYRYQALPFLSVLEMRMAAGAADLIICRAGSTTLFEVALWKKPALIIPIPEDVSHDQRRNAFAYARTGGGSVIEEHNLTPNLLASEIQRILGNKELQDEMSRNAEKFAKPDAAEKLAETILDIGLSHEHE